MRTRQPGLARLCEGAWELNSKEDPFGSEVLQMALRRFLACWEKRLAYVYWFTVNGFLRLSGRSMGSSVGKPSCFKQAFDQFHASSMMKVTGER